MSKKNIKALVAKELEVFLEENQYELYNVEFVKEGKDWFLRVFIDHLNPDEGIGTDDCEKVSRFLSARLDELDPIQQNYYLEVSSPGMDRALIKEKDYERYAGRLVDIILYKSMDGSKTITGTLVGLIDGHIVVLDSNDKQIEIPIDKAAKTKLAVVF
ncbi:MAG: ribosome maturation factor RimP [Anaerovoracaceae bacterium]|jgi:ribosome maturation factor RimP